MFALKYQNNYYQLHCHHYHFISIKFTVIVVTKLHVCYQLGVTGWNWVQSQLGSNFSGNAGGVSDHA